MKKKIKRRIKKEVLPILELSYDCLFVVFQFAIHNSAEILLFRLVAKSFKEFFNQDHYLNKGLTDKLQFRFTKKKPTYRLPFISSLVIDGSEDSFFFLDGIKWRTILPKLKHLEIQNLFLTNKKNTLFFQNLPSNLKSLNINPTSFVCVNGKKDKRFRFDIKEDSFQRFKKLEKLEIHFFFSQREMGICNLPDTITDLRLDLLYATQINIYRFQGIKKFTVFIERIAFDKNCYDQGDLDLLMGNLLQVKQLKFFKLQHSNSLIDDVCKIDDNRENSEKSCRLVFRFPLIQSLLMSSSIVSIELQVPFLYFYFSFGILPRSVKNIIVSISPDLKLQVIGNLHFFKDLFLLEREENNKIKIILEELLFKNFNEYEKMQTLSAIKFIEIKKSTGVYSGKIKHLIDFGIKIQKFKCINCLKLRKIKYFGRSKKGGVICKRCLKCKNCNCDMSSDQYIGCSQSCKDCKKVVCQSCIKEAFKFKIKVRNNNKFTSPFCNSCVEKRKGCTCSNLEKVMCSSCERIGSSGPIFICKCLDVSYPCQNCQRINCIDCIYVKNNSCFCKSCCLNHIYDKKSFSKVIHNEVICTNCKEKIGKLNCGGCNGRFCKKCTIKCRDCKHVYCVFCCSFGRFGKICLVCSQKFPFFKNRKRKKVKKKMSDLKRNDDEDRDIQRAIELSLSTHLPQKNEFNTNVITSFVPNESNDGEIQRAIQLSLEDELQKAIELSLKEK